MGSTDGFDRHISSAAKDAFQREDLSDYVGLTNPPQTRRVRHVRVDLDSAELQIQDTRAESDQSPFTKRGHVVVARGVGYEIASAWSQNPEVGPDEKT
jgi:hypothetical protein